MTARLTPHDDHGRPVPGTGTTGSPPPSREPQPTEPTEGTWSQPLCSESGSRLLSRTAIIVVSYDSASLLSRNLAQVAQAAPEAAVVVVDNYSGPQARADVLGLAEEHGWSTVLPTTNLGFGAGMNLGAAQALSQGAEVLVLLNPDAVIDRANLVRLVTRAAGNPSALVAPVLTDSGGRTVSDGAVVCLADGSMRSRRSQKPIPPGGTHPWLSGACLALSGELFEAVGGFDARYFLYWEDVDFSSRILASGGSLVLARDATAIHDEGGTHAQGHSARAKSDTYYYYNIRNRLLYAGLHLDRSHQRRWAVTSLAAARETVLRGGRRQLLDSRQPLRTAVTATRDGLTLLRQVRRGLLPDPTEPVVRSGPRAAPTDKDATQR
ncbi:glycosyltransferase family 2 protein [Actinomyces lilanjuaniae]|uniref:Glycosyltransferase family 2 protein n=1 Tax=Actinomyces lilanjuaniae TaxID=2321394 RepID=A0ABN5PTY3_9ACTO|nr:glycosyltransferase family 2 protein [Actinomyces lilanjuaniae]AYD90411.1 glycosyltransferase family 2 protein [Actinomyces lilanjuaniae]